MVVSFRSLDSENNKIEYIAEAKQVEDYIEFEDKSCFDTKIRLKVGNGIAEFTRVGFISMSIKFQLNETTPGAYVNAEGLDFEFEIFTTELQMDKDKLSVRYNMIMDNNVISKHFIQISFFKNLA